MNVPTRYRSLRRKRPATAGSAAESYYPGSITVVPPPPLPTAAIVANESRILRNAGGIDTVNSDSRLQTDATENIFISDNVLVSRPKSKEIASSGSKDGLIAPIRSQGPMPSPKKDTRTKQSAIDHTASDPFLDMAVPLVAPRPDHATVAKNSVLENLLRGDSSSLSNERRSSSLDAAREQFRELSSSPMTSVHSVDSSVSSNMQPGITSSVSDNTLGSRGTHQRLSSNNPFRLSASRSPSIQSREQLSTTAKLSDSDDEDLPLYLRLQSIQIRNTTTSPRNPFTDDSDQTDTDISNISGSSSVQQYRLNKAIQNEGAGLVPIDEVERERLRKHEQRPNATTIPYSYYLRDDENEPLVDLPETSDKQSSHKRTNTDYQWNLPTYGEKNIDPSTYNKLTQKENSNHKSSGSKSSNTSHHNHSLSYHYRGTTSSTVTPPMTAISTTKDTVVSSRTSSSRPATTGSKSEELQKESSKIRTRKMRELSDVRLFTKNKSAQQQTAQEGYSKTPGGRPLLDFAAEKKTPSRRSLFNKGSLLAKIDRH
ncbi:hypothetical protein V1511DRAFT_398046 [Dipodascopsis uninucleata]